VLDKNLLDLEKKFDFLAREEAAAAVLSLVSLAQHLI
jgi:hypothetical protein